MLVSIGFEIETRALSVVRIYPGKIVYNPKTMYRVTLRRDPLLQVYPDIFTEVKTRQASLAAWRQDKAVKDLGGGYIVPNDKLPSLFSHAEFVVTYARPVEVPGASDIPSWTLDRLAGCLEDVLRNTAADTEHWRRVDRPSQREPSSPRFYYHGDFVVHKSQPIGILSREPGMWSAFPSKANIVVQCTYGIPLTAAYRTWKVLQQWFHEHLGDARPDRVGEAWAWASRLSSSSPWEEDSVEGNLLFLWYYSFMTRDERKKNAVFVVRHPMINLWFMALSKSQRAALRTLLTTSLSPTDPFLAYCAECEASGNQDKKRQTQRLIDVGLVPFDRKDRRFFFEYRGLTMILRNRIHGDHLSRLLTMQTVHQTAVSGAARQDRSNVS